MIFPGFYSLEWIKMSKDQIQHQSSGTGIKVSLGLLDQAGTLIEEERGSSPMDESIAN